MTTQSVLLIDIGNSNLKWVLLNGEVLSAVKAQWHRDRSIEQLTKACWADLNPPAAVYLASVANRELCKQLSQWMQRQWGVVPEIVRSEAELLGVINGYRDPGQLGVDRWLTLLAARQRYTRPVCIVDCGTALTVDLMLESGQHCGGVILPGLDLMRESLLARTHIPRVTQATVESLFGHDTATAVASAALNAAVGLIERSLSEAEKLCGTRPQLLLTGSDAEIVARTLREPCEIDQALVMEGLAAIARARSKSA